MHARLDPATRHPVRERVRVVVATGPPLLHDGQPPELPSPNHQGRFQQPPAFQVGEQPRDGLVGLLGEARVVLADVAVSVPAQFIVHPATVDLHEPRAPFDQAAGNQALPGEVRAALVVEPVQLLRRLAFGLEGNRLGGGHLHAVGQLERFDAGGQVRLDRRALQVPAIEPGQQIKLRPLLAIRLSRGADEVVERRPLRLQGCPLVDPREKAGPPVLGMPLRDAAAQGVVHDHKRRQVLRLGPQAIGDPRPHAGESHPGEPGVDLEQGRRVVVRVGVTRMQKRHLVDMAGQVRKDLRDPRPRLPVLLKLKRRPHDRSDVLGEKAGVLVEPLQLLPIALGQAGLVVPGVDLAGATIHEQPDDRLRRGGKMSRPRRQRVDPGGGVRHQTLPGQQVGQCQAATAQPRTRQKPPAGRIKCRNIGERRGQIHGAVVWGAESATAEGRGGGKRAEAELWNRRCQSERGLGASRVTAGSLKTL